MRDRLIPARILTRRDFLFIATATVGAVGAIGSFLAFH